MNLGSQGQLREVSGVLSTLICPQKLQTNHRSSLKELLVVGGSSGERFARGKLYGKEGEEVVSTNRWHEICESEVWRGKEEKEGGFSVRSWCLNSFFERVTDHSIILPSPPSPKEVAIRFIEVVVIFTMNHWSTPHSPREVAIRIFLTY